MRRGWWSSPAALPSAAAGHAAVHFGLLFLGGRTVDVAERAGRGGRDRDRRRLLDEDLLGGVYGRQRGGWFVATGDAAHDDGFLALEVRR